MRRFILIGLWTATGAFLFIAVPFLSPAILMLSLVAPVLLCDRKKFLVLFARRSAITLILSISAVYLVLNSLWSPDGSGTIPTLATFVMLPIVVHLGMSAIFSAEKDDLNAMRAGLLIGFVVGAAFVSVEAIFQMPVHRFVIQKFGFTNQYSSGTSIPLSYIDYSVATIVLLFWSSLAAALSYRRSFRRGLALPVASVAIACVAVGSSEHATSKMALIGGIVTLVLATLLPRAARSLALVGWVLACTAVVPATKWAFEAKLYDAPWLFRSAQHRIVIWGATTELVAKAPMLGSGIRSARIFSQAPPKSRAGVPFPITTSLHSHNAYLQIWFETGAIGAILLLSIGIVTLELCWAAPLMVRPFLFATFVSTALEIATSYSIWAPWFLSALGVTAMFSMVVAALDHTDKEGGFPHIP